MRALTAAVVAVFVLACGESEKQSVRVTVPPGATMSAIAESLHRADVIGSPKMFRFYAKLRRADRGLKAGTYLFKKDEGWGAVISALRSGKGVVNVVLIPEGFTLAQTESVMVARMRVPADSIRAAVRDTATLRRLGIPSETLEGYLFPDTYFFPPGMSGRAAVQAMVRRFEQQWKTAWGPRLDTLGVSRHNVVTLASIVEREARLASERPVIAAVYWNRLRKGMLLQADPTVQYALPQYQQRLLNRHLTVASRYNTYRYRGLPPGPIAAPGRASLEATLYPAQAPYLYFVAHPDGHHEFRVKLEEHQAAVRASRRAWSAVRAQAQKAPTRTPPG
ncbi:MAG: endolytic transglycosylase MltG [Gemmatimonadaceae bacterium]